MPTSSFILDAPIPPQLDLAGAPSQLFQVPPTPSASSALYRSIAVPSSSRKRSRASPENRSWLGTPVDRRSPAPCFVAADDRHFSPMDDETDIYRPSRYRNPPPLHPLDASVESLGDLGSLRCKRSRRDPSSVVAASPADEKSAAAGPHPSAHLGTEQPAPVRWSRAVLNVVGKVWDFCWSGAFRGFYAGGGQGYSLAVPHENNTPPSHTMADESRTEKRRVSFVSHHRSVSTPVPGEYPEDSDLRRNWVMISSRDTGDRLDDTYMEANDEIIITPSARPRRVVHRRTATTPSYTRRRTAAKKTLMSHPSAGSTKSQFSSPAKPHESPVSVETQRYMAQKRRMEREEDASLRRLNRQLQAMIREGKQALGTRVEVDDYMEE